VIEPLRDHSGRVLGLLGSAIDASFLKETIIRLQKALSEVQVLHGLLPICASCKKIRDEHETWQALESYIQAHSEAKFSHGLCPDCLRKLYPEQHQRWGALESRLAELERTAGASKREPHDQTEPSTSASAKA
jgi:hypothetical protein